MRLSHVIEQVYFRPWCIKPSAWRAIDRLIDSKLAASPETVAAAIRSAAANHHGQGADAPGAVESGNPLLRTANGVATITISGVIGRRLSWMEKACMDCTDTIDISDALDRATHDTTVREIMLDVDTPGGSVTGIPELGAKIALINERIVTVKARTAEQICSAGYWLVAGCEEITATQTSDVGSIGVYSAFLDTSLMYAAAGAKMEVFAAGKYKGQGMDGTSLSGDMKKLIQSEVDQIAAWFKSFVTEQRAKRGAKIEADTMEGQSFMGEEALARGLVDRLEQYEPAAL